MAHSEARAWWADVQHLRDGYERTDEARRRADEADLATRRATRERRHVEAEVCSVAAAPRTLDRAARVRLERRAAPRVRTAGAPRRASEPRSRRAAASTTAPSRQDIVPSAEPPRGPHVKGAATPGRRTIEIRGRTVPAPTVPRPLDTERRAPAAPRGRARRRASGPRRDVGAADGPAADPRRARHRRHAGLRRAHAALTSRTRRTAGPRRVSVYVPGREAAPPRAREAFANP